MTIYFLPFCKQVPTSPNAGGHSDEAWPIVWDVYVCGCLISRLKNLNDREYEKDKKVKKERPRYKLKGELCPLRQCEPCALAGGLFGDAENIYSERYMDAIVPDLEHKWKIAKEKDAFVDGDNPPPKVRPWWIYATILDQAKLKVLHHDRIYDEAAGRMVVKAKWVVVESS
ncbi:hypothetical protein EAF04_002151 [Stromatinia cepivora]|nr:hypothetical protein EAF04_002151 [Stromatinia cepivora]